MGFICADGYISKKNYLKITLKDLEVLEKFVRDIETTYPIRTYTYIDKRTGNSHVEYEVQITNRKFTSYIITHGVTHDKTNVLNFPNINEEYYPSFIAGLIDGDGSVYLKTYGTKYLCLNLVATKEILESIIN